MASIIHRNNGTFQARIKGSDGKLITKVFSTRKDAVDFSIGLEGQKVKGGMLTSTGRNISLDEYFEMWFQDAESQASSGWRKTQKQIYRDHISPYIGEVKLSGLQTPMVARILNHMTQAEYSEQMKLHVFTLLRKMFGDAIELYQYLTYNPIIKKIKPRVPLKEAKHLSLEQIKTLLAHVVNTHYGPAVFIQLYLGLRVGEMIALRWSDLDLDSGVAFIRRTYVRKEKCFREHPKGRKQHSKSIPPELLEMLRKHKERSTSEFVVTATSEGQLSYEWYCRSIQRFCRKLGLPEIGSHGLRHSTSEVYLSSGATRDDLRQLFAHSSPSVTDRYIHSGSNVDKVAQVIRLFSKDVSTPCPRKAQKTVDQEKGIC